jgi:16S rRNA (cytosine1402-N4)-methyltransferase
MHQPVLVKEVLEALAPERCDIIVDATAGTGGHAQAILARLRGKAKLICIDRDRDALRIAKRRLAGHEGRVHFAHLEFGRIEALLSDLNLSSVSGFLFDLGLCALHLQNAKRGFSFQSDGPLDMRMNRTQSKNACDVVGTYPFSELTRLLRDFGQERFSKRIARAVVNRRKKSPIRTTFQLREVVESAIDKRYRIKSLARVFQAIRIEVNDELNQLKQGLDQAIGLLAPGGRLALISYHSLEHRLIREKLGQKSRGCICPPDLPVCGCGARSVLRVITRKPVIPAREEIDANPSARSAKLWAAEKLGTGTAEE